MVCKLTGLPVFVNSELSNARESGRQMLEVKYSRHLQRYRGGGKPRTMSRAWAKKAGETMRLEGSGPQRPHVSTAPAPTFPPPAGGYPDSFFFHLGNVIGMTVLPSCLSRLSNAVSNNFVPWTVGIARMSRMPSSSFCWWSKCPAGR